MEKLKAEVEILLMMNKSIKEDSFHAPSNVWMCLDDEAMYKRNKQEIRRISERLCNTSATGSEAAAAGGSKAEAADSAADGAEAAGGTDYGDDDDVATKQVETAENLPMGHGDGRVWQADGV